MTIENAKTYRIKYVWDMGYLQDERPDFISDLNDKIMDILEGYEVELWDVADLGWSKEEAEDIKNKLSKIDIPVEIYEETYNSDNVVGKSDFLKLLKMANNFDLRGRIKEADSIDYLLSEIAFIRTAKDKYPKNLIVSIKPTDSMITYQSKKHNAPYKEFENYPDKFVLKDYNLKKNWEDALKSAFETALKDFFIDSPIEEVHVPPPNWWFDEDRGLIIPWTNIVVKVPNAKAEFWLRNSPLVRAVKEFISEIISEAAEYQGRKVKLNDPIRNPSGSKKKFRVYVKDGDKVKKVEFGDPNMEIKRDDPKRRKSFRARHKCDQNKDKTSPSFWSCKQWRANKKVNN